MAKLSKVDAAKAAGVSRQTLYTYIKDGRLSVDADGLVDTAELLRAGFALRTGHHPGRQATEPVGHPLTSTSQPLTSSVPMLDVYQDMIAMLKQQLSDAQAREQAALERERSAREREVYLLRLVEQMQQRYDRLLDMPRSAPVVSPAHAPQAARPLPAQRGDMRRRILALLRDHPEGLSPAQVRELLGVEKPLGKTMTAMVRDGLIHRLEYGKYTSI
jgi:AcrR family transcriptional regulator